MSAFDVSNSPATDPVKAAATRPMKVTVLTGFLGAGKTTFLKRLLHEQADRGFGVIVNDLSELEVDGELVRLGHAVGEEAGTLVSLTDGSISGSRRGDFSAALRQLAARGIGHVLVETSGGTHPAAVLAELRDCPGTTLHAVATLVDARALYHDYEGGPGLARLLAANEEAGTRSIANLLADQLQVASVIVVTKIDLVPEDALPLLLRTLQMIHPGATLAACAYGRMDPSMLLDAPPYAERENALTPATAPGDEDGLISAIVIRDARPLHPQRFYDLYREQLPVGLYRSKGFLWFASRSDQCLLWNQAGGAMGLELLSYWRAYILANDTRLLPEEREHLGTLLRDTHPVFGDRACEFTLIGLPRDRDRFAASLQDCFCTEAEIAHWQAGGDFPDPWPKRLKLLE